MTVKNQLTFMSWATLAMFFVVGGTSYVSVARLIDTHTWLEHSQKILEKGERLLYRVTEAASTERAYVITGQAQYLEPYQSAVHETRETIKDLKELVKDNPDQVNRLNVLIPIVEERLDNFDNTIATYKYPGPQAAIDMVRKGNGKVLMDVLRANASDFLNSERILLRERDNQADHSQQSSLLTVIFGALLSMVVVFFYNFFTAEKISENIKLLLKSIENMNRDRFDSAPPLSTNDEFGEISKSIYQLGLKIQFTADELHRERFLRVEAESEREYKAARLRELSGSIDAMLLATKQLRISLPDENPYSQDGAEPASAQTIKELSRDVDRWLKRFEDDSRESLTLHKTLDERFALIHERARTLESKTDDFLKIGNDILAQLASLEQDSSEQMRKNAATLKGMVHKITQLAVIMQHGCDETALNADRGLRAIRTANNGNQDASAINQVEAKDRLVKTALEYVKVFQNTVERDRRLWNRFVEISQYAQQIEVVSNHISSSVRSTDGTAPSMMANESGVRS